MILKLLRSVFGEYVWAAVAVAVVLILSSTFYAGVRVEHWRMADQIASAEKKAEQDRAERSKKASEVVSHVEKQKVEIRWKTRTIIQRIRDESGDGMLCDDASWVRLGKFWNETNRSADGVDAALPAVGRPSGTPP